MADQIAIIEGLDLGATRKAHSMSRSRLSALPPPLEMLDDFGFLGGPIVDKQMLIEAGLASGGGAVFALGLDALQGVEALQQYIADSVLKQVLANVGLGVVAGRLLWYVGRQGGSEHYMGRDAAKGMLGAMAANLGRLARDVLMAPAPAPGTGMFADAEITDDLMAPMTDEDILLSDASVYEQRQLQGAQMGDTDVSELRPGQLASLAAFMV